MKGLLRKGFDSCLWGLRCGNRGFILLLSLLAVSQITIAIFTLIGKEIPIPRALADTIFNRLLDPAWKLELHSARIDLLGGVRAEQVVLRSRGEGYRILEIEQLWADLDLWEWLFKTGPGLDRLAISNATLLAPGHMSATGLESKLLQELDLKLEMGHGWLDLKHLQSRVDGHPLVVMSRERLELPTSAIADEQLNIVVLWSQWIPAIIRWKEMLPAWEGLLLKATLETLKPDFVSLNTTVFAEKVLIPQGELIAEQVELEFPHLILGGNTSIGRATIRAKKIQSEEGDWILNYPILHLPHFAIKADEAPSVDITLFHVYSANLETPWENLLGLSLSSGFHSQDNALNGRAGIRHTAGNIALNFALERNHGAGEIHLSSDAIEVMDLLGTYLKPEWMEHVPVAQDAIRFQGSLLMDAYLEPSRLNWSAEVTHLQIDEVNFPYVRAQGTSTLSYTDIYNAEAWMPGDQQARLRYWQGYPLPRFELVAEGQSLQSNLDPILDFPWWWQIWEEVSSENQVVEADVRVEGVWGNPETTRSWVGIHANNVAFRDLPLRSMHLSLSQSYGKVDIYRMGGRTPGGQFNGTLHWRIPNGQPELAANIFHVHGRVPVSEIQQLLGEEENDWLDEFQSEATPQLLIHMSRHRELENDKIVNRGHYRIDIHIDQPTIAYGLPIDHLQAFAEVDEAVLSLRHTYLKTLGGEVWMELDLGRQTNDTTPPFRLSLAGRNLIHTQSTDILRKRFLQDVPEPETSPAKPGKMDADLKLAGHLEQIETYGGTGTLIISEADLGQVRIFGELSRLFDSVGLPFTSLDLERFQATWQMQDGEIKVSDAHISGPSIRLKADGSILIPGSELDFTVQAFVIRGLFGLVFRPVNMVFEFRLGGELADPQWSLRINPFRWLAP